MKRIKWLVVIGIASVLALTNPPMHTYTIWADQTIQAHTSSFVSAIASLFSGSVQSLVENNTVRDNFILFSVYKTSIAGHNLTVLGIFNHFVPLSNS